LIGAKVNVARHIEGYSRAGSQSGHFQAADAPFTGA